MSPVMLPWSSRRRTWWYWRDERLVAALCAARGVPPRAPGAVVPAWRGRASGCFAGCDAVGSGRAPGDCDATPEAVRRKFSTAFSAWYAANYHAPVEVD